MAKKILVFLMILISSLSAAEMLSSSDFVAKAQKEVTSIDTAALQKILAESPNTQLIDVRIREDILRQGGYIKANKVSLISRDKLEFLIAQEVKADEQFVVYCFDGRISLLAAKQLQDMGFKNVLHYKESFRVWQEQKLPSSSLDRYLDSFLYSPVQKVAEGVYTSIGQTSPSSYENSAHNNNLGFVIGNDAVAVWNASSSYLLARALHDEIKKVTDKPVKYVILENSQGHAMMGSNYWKEQGAQIIAHEIAKKEIEKKGQKIYDRYKSRLRDKFTGTKVVLPDVTFKEEHTIDLGGRVVKALYFGYAHEHSDISIWLPKEKITFAGDLAFNNRVLPIFEITETKKWLEAWEKFAALKPKVVVPGHGDVTDLATVERYTKGYLLYLREKVSAIIEEGGELEEAYAIDQSPYAHLDTFKELALRNVATLFKQMEFEE
jgi:glyoxylase-like metal-dependent hydrolase (beta-lactamase superfamily II)/rhodanese-related sulfurtransferase